jgi:hypothetical protein
MSLLLTVVNLFKDFMTPIGSLWGFLLVLAFWLMRRKRKIEAVPVLAVAALVWVLGATPIAPRLLQSLESPFYSLNITNLTSADAVIMLGGTLEPSPSDPRRINLTRAADRIVAAVDLLRLHKGNALVLGGGAARIDGRDYRESVLIQSFLSRWKLVDQPILSAIAQNHPPKVEIRALKITHLERLKRLATQTGSRIDLGDGKSSQDGTDQQYCRPSATGLVQTTHCARTAH